LTKIALTRAIVNKIVVIGLEGHGIEQILGDKRLTNFLRLADGGCYGGLTGARLTPPELNWISFAMGSVPASLSEAATPLWTVAAEKGQRVGVAGIRNAERWIAPEARLDVDLLSSDEPVKNDVLQSAMADSTNRFAAVRAALATGEFGYLQLVDSGLQSLSEPHGSGEEYILHLDRELGSLLEILSDDTVLCVVAISTSNSQGGFILNSAKLHLTGEIADISIADLAPTLVNLSGFDAPPTMNGRSLIAGNAAIEASAEDMSEEARQLVLDRLSGLGYI
jgi:hypothetical protein